MKKNLTELVFILDRSGSMRGLEKDTIGGFTGCWTNSGKRKGMQTSPRFFSTISTKRSTTAFP